MRNDDIGEQDDLTRHEFAVEELSKKIKDHTHWELAVTRLFNDITAAFYELGRRRNYDATDCRRHLAMNMLYHMSLLALEDGLGRDEFLDVCLRGYDSSVAISAEQVHGHA